MKQRRTYACVLLVSIACALTTFPAGAASSDESEVKSTIQKWVADFNHGDSKALFAACAPRTSFVDGFPPYAWYTCKDWLNAFYANNKVIHATHGVLSLGKPIYGEVTGDHAYFVYPATFADTQSGKPFFYKGIGTMALQKTRRGWLITGSGWAWGFKTL